MALEAESGTDLTLVATTIGQTEFELMRTCWQPAFKRQEESVLFGIVFSQMPFAVYSGFPFLYPAQIIGPT